MTFFDPLRDGPSSDGPAPPPTDPWAHRPQITLGVRLVDNGALIYATARNTGPQFKAPPESVARSVDEAVEIVRRLLQQVWPAGAK